MIALSSYLTESSQDGTFGVSNIVDMFIDDIDKFDPVKRQHFLYRLSLCKDISWDSYQNDIRGVRNEMIKVMSLIEEKKWDDIIEKYVSRPYKNNKKSTYKFLTTLKHKEYVCYGHLLNTIDILRRITNGSWVGLFFSEDYERMRKLLDVRTLLDFHENDVDRVKDHCGTIYINYIGSIKSLYKWLWYEHAEDSIAIEIENKWLDDRLYYMDKPFTHSNLYAVTHTIINESGFYKKKLSVDQYKKEADYIDRWLYKARVNSYRNVSLDLLCECALCERMIGEDVYSEWRYVNRFLQKKIDKKTHILQHNSDHIDDAVRNLKKNEHTNILYILLNNLKLCDMRA